MCELRCILFTMYGSILDQVECTTLGEVTVLVKELSDVVHVAASAVDLFCDAMLSLDCVIESWILNVIWTECVCFFCVFFSEREKGS